MTNNYSPLHTVQGPSRFFVAFDNMNQEQIHEFLKKAHDDIQWVKIGMEVFYRYGRTFLEEISERYQKRVFLDLKLHDIPNTVFKAIQALKGLPIDFLTLHLAGGKDMLLRALESQQEFLPNTRLLGVTFLTSLGEEDFNEIWDAKSGQIERFFHNLISLAYRCGLHGIVLSPHELPLVQGILNGLGDRKILKVCPGIRFPEEPTQDQKRVASPHEAIRLGADYLVIGRSLTQSEKWKERLSLLSELSAG